MSFVSHHFFAELLRRKQVLVVRLERKHRQQFMLDEQLIAQVLETLGKAFGSGVCWMKLEQ